MDEQRVRLRWHGYRTQLQKTFSRLLECGLFCDVTLACVGGTIRAHRMVLCASSWYFEELLTGCYADERDPIIILPDARYEDMQRLVEFMYSGVLELQHANFQSVLAIVDMLRLKGLTEEAKEEHLDDDTIATESSLSIPINPEGSQAEHESTDTPAGSSRSSSVVPSSVASSGSSARKRAGPPLDTVFTDTLQPAPKLDRITRTVDAPSKTTISFTGSELSNMEMAGVDMFKCAPAEQGETSSPPFARSPQAPQGEPTDGDDRWLPLLPIGHNDSHAAATPDNVRRESDLVTPEEAAQWADVVRLSDYVTGQRRRQAFWDEPFVKRVLDAVKSRTLGMKKAAAMLGVSYGTLYGRYREAHGCLNGPYKLPYIGQLNAACERALDVWHAGSGSDRISEILSQVQQHRITAARTAELFGSIVPLAVARKYDAPPPAPDQYTGTLMPT